MKGAYQFETFAFDAYSNDKDFTVVGVSDWLEYETKKPMGWKVDTVITRDDTKYRVKDGQVISNLYQTQAFKCAEKPDVKVGDIIRPVGPVTATLYGEYRNQLSIKCQTVRAVNQAAGKDKG